MKNLYLFVALLFVGTAANAQDCVDPSLIDPNAICFTLWDPVCGCNGVTYGNSCEAENWGGVTSWTPGECGQQGGGDDCLDLGEIDFGLCDMVLGVALVDGQCITLSGCSTVGSDGIDYAQYIYPDLSLCEACQDQDECVDLANVDFGDCAMPLGVALVDGECVMLSGCDWVGSDGIDYSDHFYDSMDECLPCADGGCLELGNLDFGPCDAILGVGLIAGSCQYISGCSLLIGKSDYSPFVFDDMESCEAECGGGNDCVDPSVIDLTIQCPSDFEPVCGCDGQTYMNSCVAFYHHGITDWEKGGCDCTDPNIVDPNVFCIGLWDPVCGCDSVTYGNSCEAWYWGGVTEWTQGPCGQMSGGECMDLEGIDFGDCEAIIGYAVYDGGCQAISGCSQTDVNGTDYSNYFFDSIGSCETTCDSILCFNSSVIDQNVMCSDIYEPVCGCDGVTYSNSCEAYSWNGIQFWTDGPCDTLCVDSTLIDINAPCDDIYDPVCGCNGITYSNACEALEWNGVTSWTAGPCDSANVIQPIIRENFVMFPNPASDVFVISTETSSEYNVSITDLAGRKVIDLNNATGRTSMDVSALKPGIYAVVVYRNESSFVERLVIQ